jgi:ribulose bisphosphate carboxylase small subunit
MSQPPRTTVAGNLLIFEGADSRGHEVTIHVHSADPSIAYLNARTATGYSRPFALDPATARRVAEVLVNWADQREGGR